MRYPAKPSLSPPATRDSQPVSRNPVHFPRGWFETAVEKAALQDYTWHCNPCTLASRLVMAGVDIRTVARLMGHSTIQMTMRYSHLAPEHTETAVERLELSGQLVNKSVTTREARRVVLS